MTTALCKWRGTMVLMEIAATEKGVSGRCPQCGGERFRRGEGWATGWTECVNCDFAVLTKHLLEEDSDGRSREPAPGP